ncbi:MAG TPA: DUF4337 family protein [Kofleriaceae bacterium]|nr:DUF4337 family protein [Kofleriaceae bacterium]
MSDERHPDLEADRLSASVDEIERAIDTALAKLEAERKAEAALAHEATAHKNATSRRVSLAALLLTMMVSFLGFVRAQSDSNESDDKLIVQQSKSDAATEWALYQTKTAQRSGYLEAEDTLAREILALAPDDPRRRLARFHHHEYEAKVRQLDDENRAVFHRIQSLDLSEYHARRDAAHHHRRTDRYDMGIRTITLALVLISVTLLVDSSYLFWVGLLVAAIGAALGVTGYFLH